MLKPSHCTTRSPEESGFTTDHQNRYAYPIYLHQRPAADGAVVTSAVPDNQIPEMRAAGAFHSLKGDGVEILRSRGAHPIGPRYIGR